MENTFKMKSLSLLLKINIWTAFFVLLAGIVIIAGCSSPQGGDTKDEQVIEKPTKPTDPTVNPDDPTINPDDPTVDPDDPTVDPNDPTIDPNDPTVDPDNPTVDPDDPTIDPDDPTVDPDDPTVDPDDPTVDPDDPTVDPDDPTIDPDAPTVDPDNPTVDPDDPTIDPDDPVVYGGEPYDKAIGNGNYILHNFIGENTSFTEDTVVAGTNHYLGKAETYLKDLASNWNESMKDRPAAQNYFADLITAVQNDQYFYIDKNYPDDQTFDTAVNKISYGAESYFTDIVKNLDNSGYGSLFYYCYRTLANESYKEGLGSYRQYSSPQMDAYNEEKESIKAYPQLIDYDSEYGEGNFTQTTQYMDKLLDMAVTNMNNNDQGVNMKVEDLRQLINLSLTLNSLSGMHDFTKGNLHHTQCEMGLSIRSTIYTANVEKAQAEQSQTMGL